MSYAHGIEENHIERMQSSEMRGSLECRISSSPEEWVAFKYRLSNGVLYEFASREDELAGRHRRALDLADVIKVSLQGRDERTFRIAMRGSDVHLRARNEQEAREWAFGFHHSIVLLVERLARSQRQHLRVSRARRSTLFPEPPGSAAACTRSRSRRGSASSVESDRGSDRDTAVAPAPQATDAGAQPIAARMLAHRAQDGGEARRKRADSGSERSGAAAGAQAADWRGAGRFGRGDNRLGAALGAALGAPPRAADRHRDAGAGRRGLSSSLSTGGVAPPARPPAPAPPQRQGSSPALDIRREAVPVMRRGQTDEGVPARHRRSVLRKSSLSAQLERGPAAGSLSPSSAAPRGGIAVERGGEAGSTRAQDSGSSSSPGSHSRISTGSAAAALSTASPPARIVPMRAASDGAPPSARPPAAAAGGAYMPPWMKRKLQQEQAGGGGSGGAAKYVPPSQRRRGGGVTGARLLEQWAAEEPAGVPTEEERTAVVERTVQHADGRQERTTVTATASARGMATADGGIEGLRGSSGHATRVLRGAAPSSAMKEDEEDRGRYAARENGFFGVLTTKGSKNRNDDRYVAAVRVGAGHAWEPLAGAEHGDVSEAAKAYTESLRRHDDSKGGDAAEENGSGNALSSDAPCSIFCVFDGHCGARASEFAAAALPAALTAHRQFGGDQRQAVQEAFLAVDDAFLEHAREKRWDDGTTAIVVVLRPRSVLVANLGDCRAVLAHGSTAVDLSQDHTPKKEQERIETAGGWLRKESELFLGRLSHMDLADPAINVTAKQCHWVETYRVNGELAVSRALGDCSFKGRGLAESEWHFPSDHPGTFQGDLVLAECEVSVSELGEEDEFIIIACDGLWDVVSSDLAVRYVKDRIRDHLHRPTPQFACDELVRLALRLGSGDNVTAIVIMPGEQEQAMSSADGAAAEA